MSGQVYIGIGKATEGFRKEVYGSYCENQVCSGTQNEGKVEGEAMKKTTKGKLGIKGKNRNTNKRKSRH